MENNRLAVYGILKKGLELDLSKRGCKFLGECEIPRANLYGIGHKWGEDEWSGVGLRLVKDPYRVAYGELFEIPDKLWKWLDSIEQNGYCYTREIVRVEMWKEPVEKTDAGLVTTMAALDRIEYAWVYEHTFPSYVYDEHNLIKNGRFRG